MQLLISPEAEQDLLEIWLYIADDNVQAADDFLDKLNDKAYWLTEFTEAGTLQPELAEELRSFPVGRYVFYYRLQNDALVHSARDVYRHL